MKILACFSPVLMAALSIGCAHHGVISQDREQVHYYDQNGDGRVDLEVHRFPGLADADWELADTNFDWHYDVKTVYGFAVQKTAIDLPVPTGVKLEKKP